jgi:pimeloyl-ACP methyl ester carboxylesterase
MRLLCAFLSFVPLLAAEGPVRIASTSGGIRYGWLGDKAAGPAPTVFFLGGEIQENLTRPHYREALDRLGPDVFKVSLDVPGHGADTRPGEPASLNAWRRRLDDGEDVASDFVKHATAVLNHLVEAKLTDPAKVAAFGTSRGGFMALHFAAADPRVRYVAGFSPVTDLLILQEFSGMAAQHRARAMAAARLADRLHDRAIWISIGNTDYRVSTDRAIEFTQRVIEAAAARGIRPRIELHVQPSDGHSTPAGAYGAAAAWLLRQWQ